MRIRPLGDPPATADLVVIGGGVVGAATAFHASRRGLSVVLVEKRPALCAFTTAAAAGGFRLQLDNEEELTLIGESVEMFLDFEEATGQDKYDAGVRQQGYLWVTTSEARAAEQRALVEAQRGWGLEDVQILDTEAARSEFPFLTPEIVQARFRGSDGLLDPKSLTLGLAAGSRADVVLGCAVTGFRIEGGRVAGVDTERGSISTRTAAICAGPLSGLVASLAGVSLPVETVVRHKLVVPALPAVPVEAPMTIDDDTG
ncbi:MAG TPA: FAD-dependent oxidoreductase, partial [Actinomycetota bacterium]|nr:FAD-dependent oxidoreductase [Actinomycetota bacterium]